MTQHEMDKLNALNHTLGDVENELLRRRVAHLDSAMDDNMEVMNQLAAQGHVEICPCGDDEE
jgi:hypothetical protein